jgi:hypothetical protein
MTGNTEFIRNLWLEARLPRMVGISTLLGALFLLIWLRTGLSATLSNVALTAYVAIIFIWGNRLAANSVIQEVNNGTWDSQRMSAISPWAMTVGKLYGGTIFVWFSGLICLGVYAWSESRSGFSAKLIQTTIIYLCCGLLSHIISLIVSLVAIRKRRAYGQLRVWLYQFIGLAAAIPILSFATNAIDKGDRFFTRVSEISWYGMPFQQFEFVAAAIVIYVIWGNIAVYRMMRIELLSRNGPWLWLVFTIFTAAFIVGIDMPDRWANAFHRMSPWASPLWRSMSAGLLIVLFLAYVVTLLEKKDRFVFLLLKRYASERRWRNFFQLLPRQASTFVIALAIIGYMTVQALPNADTSSIGAPLMAFISIFLFAARDIGVITLMSLWHPSPRADMIALVCLAISYSLVPALFFAAGINSLRPLFQPVLTGDMGLNLTLIGLETAMVYLILAVTIRSVIKPETA